MHWSHASWRWSSHWARLTERTLKSTSGWTLGVFCHIICMQGFFCFICSRPRSSECRTETGRQLQDSSPSLFLTLYSCGNVAVVIVHLINNWLWFSLLYMCIWNKCYEVNCCVWMNDRRERRVQVKHKCFNGTIYKNERTILRFD